MGTRAGSVDPGALLYLLRHGVPLEELDHALEYESGLTALAGSGLWSERPGRSLQDGGNLVIVEPRSSLPVSANIHRTSEARSAAGSRTSVC